MCGVAHKGFRPGVALYGDQILVVVVRFMVSTVQFSLSRLRE